MHQLYQSLFIDWQAKAKKAAEKNLRAAMPGWFSKADLRTLRDELAKARRRRRRPADSQPTIAE